jgi:hypothetical protein
MHFIEFGI